MQSTNLSLYIAITALAISIWGRIETYLSVNRTRQIELVKRVGEALISAQMLKNVLGNNIDALPPYIEELSKSKNDPILDSTLKSILVQLETEYNNIWDFVKAFEDVITNFEKGITQRISQAQVEAKIAHFNQRRILAQADIDDIERRRVVK